MPAGCFSMTSPTSLYSVDKLIEQARQLATDFKKMTGKPLPGVSNEMAEHDAAKFLGLELSEDRSCGFDAKRVQCLIIITMANG